MDSWYFIVASLIVAAVGIAAAGYGIGSRNVGASKGTELPLRPLQSAESPPNPDLQIPKLATQTAKENFQIALDSFSNIVRQVDEMDKISMSLAGNRPLLRPGFGSADQLENVRQLSSIYQSVDSKIFASGSGPFFDKYMLSYKQALLSILPASTQRIWNNYNVALSHLGSSLTLVQDAERHPEDSALHNRAVQTADIFQEQFRAPVSELHQWLVIVNQRIDAMAKSI